VQCRILGNIGLGQNLAQKVGRIDYFTTAPYIPHVGTELGNIIMCGLENNLLYVGLTKNAQQLSALLVFAAAYT